MGEMLKMTAMSALLSTVHKFKQDCCGQSDQHVLATMTPSARLDKEGTKAVDKACAPESNMGLGEFTEFLGVTEPLRKIGLAITPVNDSVSSSYAGMAALGVAIGAVVSLSLVKIFMCTRKVSQPALLA